jgi:hypothetical protein
MRIKKIFALSFLVIAACILFSYTVFSQINSEQDSKQVSGNEQSEFNENVQVLKGDILDILPEPVRKFMKIRILGYPLWRIVLTYSNNYFRISF